MNGAVILKVSRAGGLGVAVVKGTGPGPVETMGGASKLQVSRSGGQGICGQEALCTEVWHAQRSEEVGVSQYVSGGLLPPDTP